MHTVMFLGGYVTALLDHTPQMTTVGYLGPGAAVSSLGAFVALVGGIVVAILGFLWYPIRRLMRRLRKPSEQEEGTPDA